MPQARFFNSILRMNQSTETVWIEFDIDSTVEQNDFQIRLYITYLFRAQSPHHYCEFSCLKKTFQNNQQIKELSLKIPSQGFSGEQIFGKSYQSSYANNNCKC